MGSGSEAVNKEFKHFPSDLDTPNIFIIHNKISLSLTLINFIHFHLIHFLMHHYFKSFEYHLIFFK